MIGVFTVCVRADESLPTCVCVCGGVMEVTHNYVLALSGVEQLTVLTVGDLGVQNHLASMPAFCSCFSSEAVLLSIINTNVSIYRSHDQLVNN